MKLLGMFAVGCIFFIVASVFLGHVPALLCLALAIGLTVRK